MKELLERLNQRFKLHPIQKRLASFERPVEMELPIRAQFKRMQFDARIEQNKESKN